VLKCVPASPAQSGRDNYMVGQRASCRDVAADSTSQVCRKVSWLWSSGGEALIMTGRINRGLSIPGGPQISTGCILKFNLHLTTRDGDFFINILPQVPYLSWCFILMRCCVLSWATKMLMMGPYQMLSRAAFGPQVPHPCFKQTKHLLQIPAQYRRRDLTWTWSSTPALR